MTFGQFITGAIITVLLLANAMHLSTIVPLALVSALALYAMYFWDSLKLPEVITEPAMAGMAAADLMDICQNEQLGWAGYGYVINRELFSLAFITAFMGGAIWGIGALLIELGLIVVTKAG